MGSIYSDAALRQYALWAGVGGVNKFAYDASISGDKIQSYPIRVPQEWLIRNGVRTRYTGVVAPAGLEISPTGTLFLGLIAVLAASKLLKVM